MPFAVAAAQTGCELLALKKEEAEPLVDPVDHLLAKYMPQMGPYGVEMMVAASIGGLAFSKYMMYLEWKKEKARVARASRSDSVPSAG